MIGLTQEELEAIRSAVVESAQGSKSVSPKSAVKRSYGVDSNGDKVVVTQVQETSPPNIKLAIELLESQIGGPQDYC